MAENKYLGSDGTKALIKNLKGYVDSKMSEVDFTYSTKATVSVGGVTKGDTLDGTLVDILDAILSPYVATSSVNIYLRTSTGGSVTTSLEQGQPIEIGKLSVSWTEGSTQVTNVKAYKGYSSTIESCTEDKLVGEQTVTSGTSAIVDITDFSATSSVYYTVVLTDGNEGNPKYVLKSSSFGSWSYPYYAGACDVTADELTSDVIQSCKQALGKPSTFKFTTDNQYPFIAVTSKITKVTDSSGVTDYTNAFGEPKEIELSSTNPEWGPTKYYVYTGSKASLNEFTFKFTY